MDADCKGEKEKDDLNDALDDFEGDPLNLTNEDKQPNLDEQDKQMLHKIQKQYESFMEEMKSNATDNNNMDSMTDSLNKLMMGLSEQLGAEGGPQVEKLKSMFSGKMEQGNFQDLANGLLGIFMKKQILYEPLLQSKASYEDYFKNKSSTTPAKDLQRYHQQFKLLCQILSLLQQPTPDKQKIMTLFQKMQEYGQPPQGISAPAPPM